MVCGAIPEPFPILDAEAPVTARWPGKTARALLRFLKTNTKPGTAKIADFL
jgi:hypothetical protein